MANVLGKHGLAGKGAQPDPVEALFAVPVRLLLSDYLLPGCNQSIY